MSEQKKRTAAKTRLEPGQHSIDRVTPFEYRGGWAIRWSIRTLDGRIHDKKSTGKTKGIARQRARAEAERLLATPGTGSWNVGKPIEQYLAEKVEPQLRREALAESTQRRYWMSYQRLLGKCSTEGCQHRHALAGLSIADAMLPRNLVNCLEEIAARHGEKTAKHAKIILSKYLVPQLKIDRLIQFNPLADLEIDYSKAPKPKVDRGGVALSRDEYVRIYEYLLRADPEDVERPKRGRWNRSVRVVEREACLDLILFQLSTGLRTSEAALRSPEDLALTEDGTVLVSLSEVDTKTRRGRVVPVLHPAVSARLAARQAATPAGCPLFPAPSDPAKPWQPRSRDRALARLYEELADRCDVPALTVERGHIWRTTLNSLLFELPEASRVAFLGHSTAVNRARYTDRRRIDEHPLLAAAASLVGTDGTDSGTDKSGLTQDEEG